MSDIAPLTYTTVTEIEVESSPSSSGSSSRRTSGLFQFLPRRHSATTTENCAEVNCGYHDEFTSPSALPDQEVLDAAAEIPIFDERGNSRLFSSIYEGPQAIGEQQLIIFVRHFYCGVRSSTPVKILKLVMTY
jgi:hypothetical protein